jgi:hypothetical protein
MYRLFLCSLIMIAGSIPGFAQPKWPKTISSAKGDNIKIYQPQPESFANDTLQVRAAVSVTTKGSEEPVFGAIWVRSLMETNRSTRMVNLQKATVTDVHFPNTKDTSVLNQLQRLLEREIPKWEISIALDQLLASLEEHNKNIRSDALNMAPPLIIYKNKPAMLVLIDGEPKFKENEEFNVETVVNTAFIIIKLKENKFYLNGGGQWYQAGVVDGPWAIATSLPKAIKKIDKKIKEKQTDESGADDTARKVIPEIVISKEPAELIQSNGEADFSPLNSTGLLYMTNTNDDIFIEIQKQQYYVLLSGRWYRASQLQGPWAFIASDQLPSDFSKIPEGSVKENVLVSVAGTDAAREAVLDAQVPQTAKVDRTKAATKVEYDGDPVFKPIEGTTIQYAVNTKSTVMLSNSVYYCVDNGVWFQAYSATGPWKVATTRPSEVEKIPPENPVYNVKYVYIYDVTPQYVYMGYTPGYVGTYVYGPTVVYGTGMYYNPWYGPYYYPRPATYGFSVHYNPYSGWSMGFHFSTGWFNMSIYGGGYGGYWGPPMYRPPYYRPPYYPPAYRPPVYPPHGHRPPPPTYNRAQNPSQLPANRQPVNRQPSISNPIASDRGNLYNNHAGVNTNDRRRPATGTRPTQQPAGGNRVNDNMFTDKQGNVYRKGDKGWEQRQGSSWQNVNNNRQNDINSLDRQQSMQDRGNTRASQYSQQNRPASRPAAAPRAAPRAAPGRRR